MGAELRSHWLGEENGLFAVMGRDELYAEYIGRWCVSTVTSRSCSGQ
jgi:hypothetical protein